MDDAIIALTPALAAGFAIQQFNELVGWLLDKFAIKPTTKASDTKEQREKKAEQRKPKKSGWLHAISLVLGLSIAAFGGIRVLEHLDVNTSEAADIIVTGLIISAGTGGINAILKQLGYTKDKKQQQAAEATSQADKTKAEALSLQTKAAEEEASLKGLKGQDADQLLINLRSFGSFEAPATGGSSG